MINIHTFITSIAEELHEALRCVGTTTSKVERFKPSATLTEAKRYSARTLTSGVQQMMGIPIVNMVKHFIIAF